MDNTETLKIMRDIITQILWPEPLSGHSSQTTRHALVADLKKINDELMRQKEIGLYVETKPQPEANRQ